jgi:hypothetical protein
MSIFDELQEEVEKRNPLAKKRAKIKSLRKQAQEAFNAQFLLDSGDSEKGAFLRGKIEAFDECLAIFDDKRSKAGDGIKRPKWPGEK